MAHRKSGDDTERYRNFKPCYGVDWYMTPTVSKPQDLKVGIDFNNLRTVMKTEDFLIVGNILETKRKSHHKKKRLEVF